MLLRFGVSVLLGHSEVDDVDDIGRFGGRSADEEVIRLDVSVNEVLLVNGLNSRELEEAVRRRDPWIEKVDVPSAWPPSPQS